MLLRHDRLELTLCIHVSIYTSLVRAECVLEFNVCAFVWVPQMGVGKGMHKRLGKVGFFYVCKLAKAKYYLSIAKSGNNM